MSWIIEWNGREYDVDPSEFSAGELKLIKQRTGLTYRKLIEAIGEQDGEAICALFWVVDHRADPDVKFTDYQGPPMKLIIAGLDGFNTAMEDLGKAMGIQETKAETTQTTPTDGGPSSPSSTPPSSTETSTTG